MSGRRRADAARCVIESLLRYVLLEHSSSIPRKSPHDTRAQPKYLSSTATHNMASLSSTATHHTQHTQHILSPFSAPLPPTTLHTYHSSLSLLLSSLPTLHILCLTAGRQPPAREDERRVEDLTHLIELLLKIVDAHPIGDFLRLELRV